MRAIPQQGRKERLTGAPSSLNGSNLFKQASLCIVGNINRDVKLQAVPSSTRLLKDGESSVPFISETVGGGGANSACAAAALGAKVRFVGKTGADSHADRLKAILQNHGVRTYLRPDPDCATGTTVAIGFQTGQRHFLSWLPNNRTLKFKDLDLRALAATQHLLRADVWFSEQMLQDGNRKLLAAARSQGLRTSLDINFDPAWSSGPGREIRRRKMALRKVLPLVDVAHGNERELCEFTDSPGLTTALERLSTWGAGSVVVHLGAKGAGYFTGEDLVIEPADKARNPVQATGTGDVLSVCMILLDSQKGIGIRDKLRIANSVVREFMEGKRILIPEL